MVSRKRKVETFTDSEVLMALRDAIKGLSLRKAGKSFGVTGAYIHDILHGRRGISEYIGDKLGFSLVPPPKPSPRKWVRK